jgi:hypothetical protein
LVGGGGAGLRGRCQLVGGRVGGGLALGVCGGCC